MEISFSQEESARNPRAKIKNLDMHQKYRV
jgi:hypothetical protein